MRKQIVLLSIVALIVLVIMLSFSINNQFYILLAIINAEISCVALFSNKRNPYSLHKIVNLFVLFFFVFANAIQYEQHSIVSSIYKRLTDDDYTHFQFVVFVILILFNVSYSLYHPKSLTVFKKQYESLYRYSNLILLLLSFFSFLLVLWHFKDNPLYMFIRGFKGDLYDADLEMNVATDLIFSKIIRAIPFACFVIAASQKKERRIQVVLFLLFLFSLFPLSIARNAVAMYWLPVLFLKLDIIKKPNVFVFTMLIGLLVIFPFLDIFRYFGDDVSFHYSLDFMNSMHFDASQEFMIIMKDHIITDGRQLLGVLFFFVPRSVWPTKPIGSGAYIAIQHGAFENISMPFFGEGYINFGYLGIFIFTLSLSYACSLFDNKYWKKKVINDVKRFSTYYYVLLGATLFVMRGDLLSSFSFTIGTILDLMLVYFLSSRRKSCN